MIRYLSSLSGHVEVKVAVHQGKFSLHKTQSYLILLCAALSEVQERGLLNEVYCQICIVFLNERRKERKVMQWRNVLENRVPKNNWDFYAQVRSKSLSKYMVFRKETRAPILEIKIARKWRV